MPRAAQLVEPFRCPGDRSFAHVEDPEGVEDEGVHLWRDVEQRIDVDRVRSEICIGEPMPDRLIAVEDAGSVVHWFGWPFSKAAPTAGRHGLLMVARTGENERKNNKATFLASADFGVNR